ncbi:hypothetical protein ACHAP5_010375 [Fusarium lateritium]
MEAVEQRIGESFAEAKKNLSPHLADELADITLENLYLTTLSMTQDIHACRIFQALEKASPSVVKTVRFPDWFFLASVYGPGHSSSHWNVQLPNNKLFFPCFEDKAEERMFFRGEVKKDLQTQQQLPLQKDKTGEKLIIRTRTPAFTETSRVPSHDGLLASRDLTYAHDTKIKDLEVEVEVANLKIANEQRETAETNAAQQFNELKELVAALLNDNQDMREEMATYQASSMEVLKSELISHRNEFDDENKKIWAEDAHTKEEMTSLRAELANVEDKLKKQHKAYNIVKKAQSHLKQAHESLHSTMTSFKNDLERDWGMFRKSHPALTPKRKDGTDLESRESASVSQDQSYLEARTLRARFTLSAN